MASQGGTSRLAQMQMRFQQRQQQEREQRKIEMTGGKVTRETTETKSLNSSFGAGKVRQMFDERRQKGPGIDRSYPLKPIPSRTAPSGNSTAAAATTTTTTTKSSTKQSTIVRKQVTTIKQVNGRVHSNEDFSNDLVNGNKILSSKQMALSEDTIDGELFPDDNEILGTISTKLPNVGRLASLSLEDNNKANNNKTNDFASGDSNNNLQVTPSSNGIKLKPVVTRKTVPIESKVQRKSSDTSQSIRTTPTLKPTPTKSTPRRPTSPTKSSPRPSPNVKNASAVSVGPRKSTIMPDNMGACRICHRNFNVDRLQKHEEICERSATKKRKMYDASKHRVQGTEAEQYMRMIAIKGGKASAPRQHDSLAKKGSSWRQKHEEFIQAIRAAKEVQAHLARGGKLSDLPPPPPSENPDYIQCPHCKRRFNQAAASRHIPKCADMIHNKPKPGSQSKQPKGKR